MRSSIKRQETKNEPNRNFGAGEYNEENEKLNRKLQQQT